MMIPVPLGPGREYRTISALASGEVVILDGISLKMDDGEIKSGDLYVAERNTGPKLLTARVVDQERGWIHATDLFRYSFDLPHRVRACEA